MPKYFFSYVKSIVRMPNWQRLLSHILIVEILNEASFFWAFFPLRIGKLGIIKVGFQNRNLHYALLRFFGTVTRGGFNYEVREL